MRRPTEFGPAESGRMGIGKEGRKGGRKEKRERKERRSLALRRRRRRRPTGKTIINHIGFDRRRDGRTDGGTDGGTEAEGGTRCTAPRVARMDATIDGQTGTVATEPCRASVGLCVVASRPHLRITQSAMWPGREEQKRATYRNNWDQR